MTLPTIVSFWHGPMSWLEELSIRSFVAAGHPYVLYSYEPIALPDGAVNRDAADILPQSEMFFYKDGRSPAVFADYFRLRLLAEAKGLWCDCDMICLKPFAGLSDHVFGFEHDPGANGKRGQLNNAVLGLPADSRLLKALLGLFEGESREIDPVWMPWFRRVEVRLRRLAGQRIGLEHMQFGATGPYPLTHFAYALGVIGEARPSEVFYPVGYDDIGKLAEAGTRLEDVLSPQTLGLHVWRMGLTDRGRLSEPPLPQPGSALADLIGRHR
ncbi:hypothetical protein [Pelagibacterium lacus]|uniref:Alpha 1,4-glycosyltransferase domain-containing protein n=1 Tax=Pelagibacterium lacus TaxID=2282655 RepID=A0A369W296_9HYPH|nr:hypothetical protein [Pelagibacterium lacus]RDE08067.1 hypothetical protein DVH29_13335 [Pelagibacterium lacus]